MMNGQQYKESLKKLKPIIYYMGEKIDSVVDHPMTKPHVNSAAMTYELAQDPLYQNLMTADSPSDRHQSKPFYPRSPEQRRSGQQGEDDENDCPENRHLFPALRGTGRHERHLYHYI